MILGCTDAIPSTLFIFILLMTFNAAQLDAIIEQYVELCVDSMDHKDMYRFVEQTLTEDFEKLNEHELLDEIRYSFDDETLERTNTVEQAIDYILEYSRFHDDLFVYEIKTGELVADSSSINEMRRELASKEQNLIEASEHPEKFTDAQIFELLVD